MEEAGQVCNQANVFVHLGGDINHNADLSIKVDCRMRTAWCSSRKYTLELYDQPGAPLELKLRMLRAKVLETVLRLRHLEPTCVPLRHAAPSLPQLPDSPHRLAKEQSHRPSDFLSGKPLTKAESESIVVVIRRKRIQFAGFVARTEDKILPKYVVFGELLEGARCVGVQGKEWSGCLVDDLRVFGIDADQGSIAAQNEGEWPKTTQ